MCACDKTTLCPRCAGELERDLDIASDREPEPVYAEDSE